MEFVILGSTALRVDGQTVSLGTAKQRGLLAVLLYNVGKPVRVETIVEHLWQERSVEACRSSLYALASRTRAALKAAGLQHALTRVQSIGAYRLDVDPSLIDYHRFGRLVDRARKTTAGGHPELSVPLLEQAIDLWQDEPLADLRGARAEHLRLHMQETLLTAQKLLADNQLQVGLHQAVLARIEPLVRENEFDETLARHWITALYAAGREEDARVFSIEFRNRFRKQLRTDPAIDFPASKRRGQLLRAAEIAGTAGGRSDIHTVLAEPPHQLPNDVPDFTGRAENLAELDALTSATAGPRVVIVSGMPGVGKTTLVARWAHQRPDRFPDGELYLDAHAYGPAEPVRPEDALGMFLDVLGVPADRIPASGEQRRSRFNQLLQNRRMLIVLDNVLNSDQVRPLLPASGTCVTVITSRNRLKGLTIREGIRGITLSPLRETERRALLEHMIGAARTDAQPGALHALAQLSGGLPLALRVIGEHVAARPRASMPDLVEELTARLLDCEGEDDDDATLRTVFAWSYHAVDGEAARLFRLLGLYSGWNINSGVAGALLGTDHENAERLLNMLARAHLVAHDTARRYRLHDLLRLYAADRVAQEEPVEHRRLALRRLLDWYLLSAANAATLLAPQRPPVPDLPWTAGSSADPDGANPIQPMVFGTDSAAMRWCESERANLHAMVRLAQHHGFHRHAWQIPGAIHEIFERYGRQDDVLEVQQIALSAAEADNHRVGQIGTLNNLGVTYFAVHEYERASASFASGLELARQANYLDAEMACLHNLASVHLKTGEAMAAIEIFDEVLETCRAIAHLSGQAATLHRLGDAYEQVRQHERAAACYREALAIRERVESFRGQAATHGQLAALQLKTGRPDLALTHCRLALQMHGRAKDDANRCDTLITAASANRELGRYPDSIRDAHEAIAISDEIADSQKSTRALTVLAETLLASGDLAGARTTCRQALQIVGDIDDPEIHSVLDRLLTLENSVARRTGAA